MNKLRCILPILTHFAIAANAQQTNDSVTQITRVINGDTVQVVTTDDGKSTVTNPKTGQTEVFQYVEQMPEPGYDVFSQLVRNIKPSQNLQVKLPVRILVRFIVTQTGEIDSPTLANDNRHNPILEEEAIRVVSALPKWKLGKQNGKTVNVWYTLPVTFQK